MKGKKRIFGVLAAAALMIMQLPVAEADASTSASDFKMEGSTLTKYRGTEKNVSVPNTVRVIGRGAFEDNTNIELVVVPNSVTRIEPYAFWGCENLDTVVLGKGMSSVGDNSFTNCTGLEQISIPSTVTTIGVEAFRDCVNLKDVTIPPETQYIHETAFDGCAQLTIHYEKGTVAEEYAKDFYERQSQMPKPEETPVPDSPGNGLLPVLPVPEETPTPQPPAAEEVLGPVLGATQVVGNKAVLFLNNTQLHVFGGAPPQQSQPDTDAPGASEPGELPDTDTETPPAVDGAGSGAALGTDFPKYRIVDGRIVADQAYYRKEDMGELELADGILEIGQFAFARSSLTSIALPQGLEKIDYGAFYYCGQLEEVSLPDSVLCVEPKAFDHSLWVENFLADGDGDGGAKESDFLISGGVLVAYRGQNTEVKVPAGVRVIAGEAFRGHEEIEKLSLPDSLRVIGEGAFEGCGGLGEVSFGKKVEEIKDRAFLGSAMAEVSLPASVKKVGLQAFGNTVKSYAGREAEYTYEDSATRLANEAYRVYERTEDQEAGVTVEGLEEIFGAGTGKKFRSGSTSLAGAKRAYTLTVKAAEDTETMGAAFLRTLGTELPQGMEIYDLELTDASGIPLRKLGGQALTVVLPVPESLAGQEWRVFALDRNGQLEELTAQRMEVDGAEAVRFEMTFVSQIGICGKGN